MRFTGQTALVTGAASGIGLATARLLAREGIARLVLVDRDSAALAAVAVDGVIVERIAGDVADETVWADMPLAGLDLAVVNAGIAGSGAIAALSFAEWRRVMTVNLDGAFLTLRATMRAIRDGGAIVVVASVAGLKPEPGIAAYAASKAGVIQLARVAARECAARSVRINAVAPGGVETPIWHAVPEFAEVAARDGEAAAFARFAGMATPLGRFARPEEIAGHIAHLLPDASAGVTGSVLTVDGGYTL